MQQIDEQERRLSYALARIGAVLESLSEPPPAGMVQDGEEGDSAADVEIARLRRLLDEAQDRQSDFADRLETGRERQAATIATMEARMASLSAQTDAQAIEIQRLRMVNVQLREALRGLREALTGGVADAGQINRAMQAELEAWRIARTSEAADLDALIDVLDPLVAAAGLRPSDPETERHDA